MKILLVEDEALLALDAAHSLTLGGLDVAGPYASGESALRQLAADRPDFAVIDWSLTGAMDGAELARELRARDIGSIMASAYRDRCESAKGAAIGFLPKPYDPSDLVKAVNVAIRYQPGDQPGPIPHGFRLFTN